MSSVPSAKKLYPYYEILSGWDCNLRCAYCFVRHKKPVCNDPAYITAYLTAMYERDARLNFYDNPYAPRIGFIGGEPLLHPELIDHALTFAHELNMKYGLNEDIRCTIATNGTLIAGSREVQDLLTKWKDRVHVIFSIDGTKEAHDMFRVDADGRGSWEQALEGYRVAREIIGKDACRAKMTPCRATAPYLSEGAITLFEAGFDIIECSCVLEEYWDESEADYVYSLYQSVTEYLLKNRLWDVKTFYPLSRLHTWMCRLNQNTTCSCFKKGMNCLGVDGIVYGCHRMAVSECPHPYGHLENGNFVVDDVSLPDKALNAWQSRPAKCLECEIGFHCFNCVSSMFDCDFDDLTAYHKRYSQCGWTKGTFRARMDYKDRIAQLETPQE